MKSFFALVTSLVAVCLAAATSSADISQPVYTPAEGDYGVYSTQNQLYGPNDVDLAKAYDNFTVGADGFEIAGFSWWGLYAEPFPSSDRSDTDFIVEIWGSDSGLADTASGPVYTFNFEGGSTAGTGGPDLTVTALGYTSPATDYTVGGGEAFSYSGSVDPGAVLSAGDYWISILANQTFSNPTEFDPEWQWHLGTGPGDGFAAYDRTLDPPGTPLAGILEAGKDLAFEIHEVPEPSAGLMAACGLLSLGLIRRKR